MNPIDYNYLLLQFKNRIFSKNGIEFQSFFEEIMEKTYDNFKKIPSGGGDGGNDGWIEEFGRYYQVYSPKEASASDSKAAAKMKTDFEKLLKNWDKIVNIKEYCFVLNDKYSGCKKPEVTKKELEKTYPNIKFNILLSKDLEKIFFLLSNKNILSLGFDISQTKAINITHSFLDNISIALERANAKFAYNMLEESKNIILNLNDSKLNLEFELLTSLCFHKTESFDKAIESYEKIAKKYPNDPRAILLLAEIHLLLKNHSKNEILLKEAEKIDKSHWLYQLELLIRKIHLSEEININSINEDSFPDNSKVRSNFYRIYSLVCENLGKHKEADSFIQKAIDFNKNKFANYLAYLSIKENRLLHCKNKEDIKIKAKNLLSSIENTEVQFNNYGDIGTRNKAILNMGVSIKR